MKGGPQTFVYDAFLLFSNQKRDRAHVEEFQHAQHESPVYDRREKYQLKHAYTLGLWLLY